MKTHFKITFIIILTALINIEFSNAQSTQDRNKKLSQYHDTILKKAAEIRNDTTVDVVKQTQDIENNLDSASAQLQQIQKKQSPAEKSYSQQHQDIIAKNHANAVRYNEMIKQELQKPNPDKAKIRQYALNITDEVNEAKIHHSEIKKKVGIK